MTNVSGSFFAIGVSGILLVFGLRYFASFGVLSPLLHSAADMVLVASVGLLVLAFVSWKVGRIGRVLGKFFRALLPSRD